MGPYLCSATKIGTHAITHYNSLWLTTAKIEFADVLFLEGVHITVYCLKLYIQAKADASPSSIIPYHTIANLSSMPVTSPTANSFHIQFKTYWVLYYIIIFIYNANGRWRVQLY